MKMAPLTPATALSQNYSGAPSMSKAGERRAGMISTITLCHLKENTEAGTMIESSSINVSQ